MAESHSTLPQVGFAHQVFVNAARRLAAFRDCPYNQRLAAAHIAGGEDTGNRGHVIRVGFDVAPPIELHAQRFDHPILDGAKEAHGDQHEIRVECEISPGNGFKLGGRPNPNRVQLFHVAMFVAGKLGGSHGPFSNAAFFMGAFGAQLKRPKRPGRAG